jgi:hypothetical protein
MQHYQYQCKTVPSNFKDGPGALLDIMMNDAIKIKAIKVLWMFFS